MSLQNLCAKRELFLTQYADMEKPIQTLRELYKDNNEKLEIIESFDRYMKQKSEVFFVRFFVVLLASIRFNLVKCLFWGSVLLLVVTLFLSGSLIVSKFHIGNYTAKKLVFTQEAIESIALCQPTQGANNTLAIANIKVISSLGEYMLIECSGIKEPQKVPMRFLVGETLHSSVDKEWIQ